MAAVTLPSPTAYQDGEANTFEVWAYDDLPAGFLKFCQTVAQVGTGQYVVVEDDSSSIGAVLIVDDPADAGLSEST